MNYRVIVSPCLFFLGGLATYIYLLNRIVLHFRNGPRKLMLIAGGFIIFIPGFISLGIVSGESPWMIVPGSLFIIGLFLELRRMRIQRSIRGVSPVCESGTPHLSMNPITTMNLRVCHYSVACRRLNASLRISLISDLHLNSDIPRSYYHHAVEQAISAESDLLFLTGDFLTSSRYAPLLREVLGEVSEHLRCFAALGNHDHWVGPEMVTDILTELGIRTLRSEHHRIRREDGSEIIISGCEEPWGTEPWSPPGNDNGSPVFVLSHTPDNIYRLSSQRVSAVFSGHYHGGQMKMPGIGSILIPSIYGKRFEHGHFVINDTHLFVSAGVGVAVPPVRVFSRPDVLVIDLHPPMSDPA
jgi:predicted MPP superfamily phosphohydrolase